MNLPLSKSTDAVGRWNGTWFAILFRWISNFSVVKQQQTGQMLSDSQENLFVCKEISWWGCAGTIELCSGSSCWTSCSAMENKELYCWLVSFFWALLGKPQIPVLMQPPRGWSWLQLTQNYWLGWEPTAELGDTLTKSSGMTLKSICFMIQSPAMQTHTHVSK